MQVKQLVSLNQFAPLAPNTYVAFWLEFVPAVKKHGVTNASAIVSALLKTAMRAGASSAIRGRRPSAVPTMGFTRFPTRGGAAARAAARAREEFCIVSNEKVAMLVWKLKRTLIGVRLDIQVNMGSGVCVLLWALQRSPRVAAPPRARRRARREFWIGN